MLIDHFPEFSKPAARPMPLSPEGLPLRSCFVCGDLGFEVTVDGDYKECWRKKMGAEHNQATPAGLVLSRSVADLVRRKVAIEPHLFYVARQLAAGTSEKPIERDRLIEGNFTFSKSPLRLFHRSVETLRSVWLLPVGSRKESPDGYWIITDAEDFAAWVARARSAPITQLTTIHRVARRNFPLFAEQLELEFWRDLGPQNSEVPQCSIS